ncbi:hypothetical protein, partial [Gracilibacillus dipsosauri]|uniref:hypothetical protein n=1 Tax=Gracilibacillus dipsosauri TaxID=178340 RepID=UPI00240A0E35
RWHGNAGSNVDFHRELETNYQTNERTKGIKARKKGVCPFNSERTDPFSLYFSDTIKLKR